MMHASLAFLLVMFVVVLLAVFSVRQMATGRWKSEATDEFMIDRSADAVSASIADVASTRRGWRIASANVRGTKSLSSNSSA